MGGSIEHMKSINKTFSGITTKEGAIVCNTMPIYIVIEWSSLWLQGFLSS
jgi:hypothetical protein